MTFGRLDCAVPKYRRVVPKGNIAGIRCFLSIIPVTGSGLKSEWGAHSRGAKALLSTSRCDMRGA